MAEKKIKVTCDGTDYVDYKILVPLQGDLKVISDDNLQKLKNSIVKYGFTAPAFIWKSGKKLYIVDSHSRVKALDSLFADGYVIPDIPIVYIKAKDKKEAKEKLLQITSTYGEFTQDGLADFILDAGLDISDLEIRLANDEFTLVGIREDGESNEYTGKITSPIYEITGENPEVNELLDTTKAGELIREIQNTEIEDPELKEFLIQAAHRHNIFTYSKVAEYYAHSNPEIQNLMEKSALVIIDFDKAIENGFVSLSKGMAENYTAEVEKNEE